MSGDSGKKDAPNITGKFDPTALERGAKALKEMGASPNASKAFEVTKMQEVTKQKELQAEIERTQNARAQALLQRASLDAEEKRKTISHQQDQERRTAQYKQQLQTELYQNKMEEQQKQIDEQLARQHQQFLRHEDLRKKNDLQMEESRRKTMEQQAALDKETMMAKAQAEAQGRIQQEKENVEVRIREMRAKAGEDRKTRLESISAIFGGIGAGSKALLEDKVKMTAMVTGLTALAVGVYGARSGTRLAANLLERNLGRPSLVRETSRFTLNRQSKGWLPWVSKEAPKIFDKIVLQKELAERLEWTTNSLMQAQANGTPYRHLLLHGPPGTGKTLFARTLSRQSGLDYAIMSGGDVGPLGKDAVHELNKLFDWANSSKRGLILFIDEADAFLRAGRQSEAAMSEEARNVLSSFLHHTGTESDKFMVVMATNVREILDRAVLDRVDEHFEFPLPSYDQRLKMTQMFFEEHIRKPTKKGIAIEVDDAIDDKYLAEIATRTEGLSGRQLAKLVLACQAAVFGSGTRTLTKGLAETVVNYKIANLHEDMSKRTFDI